MISRLQHVSEDLARIHRKCRTIGTDQHEELLKILHELHTVSWESAGCGRSNLGCRCRGAVSISRSDFIRSQTMKTYHTYRSMEQQAATKLAVVESNRVKLEQGLPKDKVDNSRR